MQEQGAEIESFFILSRQIGPKNTFQRYFFIHLEYVMNLYEKINVVFNLLHQAQI